MGWRTRSRITVTTVTKERETFAREALFRPRNNYSLQSSLQGGDWLTYTFQFFLLEHLHQRRRKRNGNTTWIELGSAVILTAHLNLFKIQMPGLRAIHTCYVAALEPSHIATRSLDGVSATQYIRKVVGSISPRT